MTGVYITERSDEGPDRSNLREVIESCGIKCGELILLPPNSKRVICSDERSVVARCTRVGDPTIRDPYAELAWAYRFAAVANCQVPLVLFPLDTKDGWNVTLWQYLVGRSPSSVEDAHEHGQLIRRLHDEVPLTPKEIRSAAKHEPISVAKVRLLITQQRHPNIAREIDPFMAKAEAYLGSYEPDEIVATHGDVNPNTVLWTPLGIVLTDFDSAGPAPRVSDVASAVYTYRRYLGSEYAQGFLDGYGTSALPTEEELIAHMWIRHLRVTIARAEHGKDIREDLDWLKRVDPSELA